SAAVSAVRSVAMSRYACPKLLTNSEAALVEASTSLRSSAPITSAIMAWISSEGATSPVSGSLNTGSGSSTGMYSTSSNSSITNSYGSMNSRSLLLQLYRDNEAKAKPENNNPLRNRGVKLVLID